MKEEIEKEIIHPKENKASEADINIITAEMIGSEERHQ